MRTFGILLLLLLLCIGLCPAYPKNGQGTFRVLLQLQTNRDTRKFVRFSDNDLQQIGSKEENSHPSYALTLRRQTRSIGSFVSYEIQQLIWTIIRIPIMIAELIVYAIRDFIFAILDLFQLFLYPFRRIMSGIVRTKRESSLLLDLSRMIFHPFEFVQDSITVTSNFARNQTARLLQDALRVGWRFLATTGLPWLRRILDRVANMPTTPDYVRTLVKNFDTMYNIFQMLGYVSPAY